MLLAYLGYLGHRENIANLIIDVHKGNQHFLIRKELREELVQVLYIWGTTRLQLHHGDLYTIFVFNRLHCMQYRMMLRRGSDNLGDAQVSYGSLENHIDCLRAARGKDNF